PTENHYVCDERCSQLPRRQDSHLAGVRRRGPAGGLGRMSTTRQRKGARGPRTPRDAFSWALLLGLNPLPGHPRSKAVALDGEGVYTRRTRPEDLDAYFPLGVQRNFGESNGAVSNGLGDVDLDSEVAVRL